MDIQDLEQNPPTYKIETTYTDSIAKAGGIPVLLPPMPKAALAKVLDKLDGVMLIGGPDYPPGLYGQKEESTINLMSKTRSKFDIDLANELIRNRNFPVLGICAGCQILNIVSGGNLIQDIAKENPKSKIQHASPDGWTKGFNKHKITLEKESKIHSVFSKSELNVVTSHHQAVDNLGSYFRKGAQAEDGTTESIESKNKRFVLGVQWHPERDFKNNEILFRNFIDKCQELHQSKI